MFREIVDEFLQLRGGGLPPADGGGGGSGRGRGGSGDGSGRGGSGAGPEATPPDYEADVLATILRAAGDMHRFDSKSFKMFKSDLKASDVLANRTSVRISVVNRQRADIAALGEREETFRRRMFKWEATHLARALSFNTEADEDYQFRYQSWKEQLTEGVRCAAEAGAHLIVFGEFDFPPAFPGGPGGTRSAFDRELKKIINAYGQPILLFAGTAHVCERKTSKFRDRLVGEFSVANVGTVYFNKALLSGMWQKERVHRIYKRTPAMKAGEKLSRVEDGIQYSGGFVTPIGRVAFLICADAYDPLIVFDIFMQSERDEDRPQIIFVPAYNRSPKLAEMCQILSMLTQSVVVLLDVCEEASWGDKRATEIWNCGQVASQGHGIAKTGDVQLSRKTVMHMWDLNWDKVDQFRLKNKLEDQVPKLHSARKLARAGGRP
jgi:hypothetical protein